jgi:hypothetical protein
MPSKCHPANLHHCLTSIIFITQDMDMSSSNSSSRREWQRLLEGGLGGCAMLLHASTNKTGEG